MRGSAAQSPSAPLVPVSERGLHDPVNYYKEQPKVAQSDFSIFKLWKKEFHLKMEACVTKVALHVSCKGLVNKDSFSKSDPLCAVYIQQGEKWTEVHNCHVF